MLKRIKYVNETTKQVLTMNVNSDEAWAVQNGYSVELYEVEQSDKDNHYYLTGYAPMKTDEDRANEEAERIAMLSLTAADVERGIYSALNKDFEDILEEIQEAAIEEIDIKALKIELKANNFYRGNPYVDTIGAFLGISSTQMTNFFETNDYTELTKEEE